MSPVVSIVLPVKNAQKHLSECLDSIQSQTLKSWELLAIDDHSIDGTRLILDEFAQGDERIIVRKNPGFGLVDALNYGIGQSRTSLIARMDGDDIMHPARLEKQVDFLSQKKAIGLVACKVEHFPQATDNERKGYHYYVEWTNSIISPESHSINRFIDCPFAHPSATFRKELIRKHGGYRNGDHPEDFELWLRWLSMGIRMEKIPEILLSWRDQPDRCSRVDPRYSQSAFHKIKASYLKQWLENELSLKERMIVCWGAGKIAKKMFRCLESEGIQVSLFLDPDPKKIGKKISSLPIKAPDQLPSPKNCFILILASARGAREEIIEFLTSKKYRVGEDFLALA